MAATGKPRRYLMALLIGYLPGIGLGFGWLMLRSDIGSGGHEWAAMSGIAHGVFARPDATLLNMRAAALVKMWVWAIPGLFVFAALGVARCRADLNVRLLASSAILTFVGYLFVGFDQGHGWGYRYFLFRPGRHSDSGGVRDDGQAGGEPCWLIPFAGATAILSLVVMIPFQLSQIEGFMSGAFGSARSAEATRQQYLFHSPVGRLLCCGHGSVRSAVAGPRLTFSESWRGAGRPVGSGKLAKRGQRS